MMVLKIYMQAGNLNTSSRPQCSW